jgi:hypothetical protein
MVRLWGKDAPTGDELLELVDDDLFSTLAELEAGDLVGLARERGNCCDRSLRMRTIT